MRKGIAMAEKRVSTMQEHMLTTAHFCFESMILIKLKIQSTTDKEFI
jgi:hypothetical protein